MPLNHSDWREIQKFVGEQIAGIGEPFVQATVVKTDPVKRLIWTKEFGDQPIPMFGHDYQVKYYDDDSYPKTVELLPQPVVNGQFIKGAGGIPVWSALSSADVGLPKITSGTFPAGPPASPSDGDIWIGHSVGNGVVWAFRYNLGSASAYKWEFIGGPPFVYSDNADHTNGSTVNTWFGITPIAPVASREGEYTYTGGTSGYFNSAGTAYMGVGVGGIGFIPTYGINTQLNSGYWAEWHSPKWTSVITAGTGIVLCAQSNAINTHWQYQWIEFIPVRVK